MSILFRKMHALGNDFVVIDERKSASELAPQRLAQLSDRREGIGCDQFLFLEPASGATAHARYRVANADGSAAEHCGNGIRCVALLLQKLGEITSSVAIEVGDDISTLTIGENGLITADMGRPQFAPASLPMLADNEQSHYADPSPASEETFGAVSIGNPHAVFEVDDVATSDVVTRGTALQRASLFPQGVNVGFMEIVDRNHIRLRVCERGVGETRACGTGACAAVAIGRRWDRLDDQVNVALPGGTLVIDWNGDADQSLSMSGPATFVYEGTIES